MKLAYIVFFLSIVAGIFLLIRRKKFSRPFFWLGLYLLGVGLLQLAGHISIIYIQSNLTLYLISVPFTYGLNFMMFHELIRIPKIKKQLWGFGSVFFSVIVAQYIFLDLQESTAISKILVTNNIAVVSFCLLYYSQMLQIPETISAGRQGIFWIVSAFFFYFLLSFIYWIVITWIRFVPELRHFNTVLVIIFYLVIWVGIIVQLNEKKTHGAH